MLNYIVDFYCEELELIIEIDGQYHAHEEQYLLDCKRDSELKDHHLIILRFTEMEVRKDMMNVLRAIQGHIWAHESKDTPL